MTDWLWWTILGVSAAVGLTALLVLAAVLYSRHRYLDQIARIFQERPLFIVPKGRPVAGAEDIRFKTPEGITLRGCYLRTEHSRRGVILFGLEFGSNRWACYHYCQSLLEVGYDVFAYEPRNQGESEKDTSYEPLQWVTDRDLSDAQAALTYLKSRSDSPVEGIGLFGISKGASVCTLLAASDPWVRCVATDGAYGTYTTMVPYMRRFVQIYAKSIPRLRQLFPNWFYGLVGLTAVRHVAKQRSVKFLSVEKALRRLRKPLLMIHGEADTYIQPEMAKSLFEISTSKDKDLWIVPGAKHNQALNAAGDEYHRKLTEFFDTHLGSFTAESTILPAVDSPTPVSTPRTTVFTPAQSK